MLNDPRYRAIAVRDRAEAHILADIAHQFWAIPREHIVVEDRSTNCGENARFTRQMLEERGIAHRTGVVIQDPTMQRRTMATFARAWQDATRAPTWYSTPGCVPVLCNGFIAHVDIPPHIAQAWQTLRDDRLLSDALSARQLA